MFYEASEAILTFSPGRDGMGIKSIPIGPRRPKNATTTNIKDQLAEGRVGRGIIVTRAFLCDSHLANMI